METAGEKRLAAEAAARIEGPLLGGRVFTDDKAPVEWLIDLSLIEFAADGAGK